PAAVVATTPHAVYLETTDADRTILCIASPAAVRVPCALVLDKAPPPQPAPGTRAEVGGGQVSVDGLGSAFRVQRWWRPPRPHGLGTTAPAGLAAAVRWLTGRIADPLDPGARGAVAELVTTLAAGEAPDAP